MAEKVVLLSDPAVPEWVRLCTPDRRVWAEDDARPPGAETLRQAIERLYGWATGQFYDGVLFGIEGGAKARVHDIGEGQWLLFTPRHVAWRSYPGASELYELEVEFP